MFALNDFFGLILSAFIILPVVAFLRESGYLIMGKILGAKNMRLTIGSGPRLKKIWVFDIRKYYHVYSWFSYDSLKKKGKASYLLLYLSPILINFTIALIINVLLANNTINVFITFWDRFIFYAFYYVLFDIVPMKTINGKPNNGMIIYEMLRYGKRVDFNDEPFLPSTTDIEEKYEKEVKRIKEIQKR